jgi:transposase
LDLSWVYVELAPYYSEIGRPSIDPVLMIRMLIVGYVFAIRSERQICREVQVNLAYRWFCDLGLEDAIPDHSAFSRTRNERFRESDIFRRVFERVVESCIEAGLVGGEGFAVDASLIEADANRQRSIPGMEWKKRLDPAAASRAVKEYLATLNAAAFGAATEVYERARDVARSLAGTEAFEQSRHDRKRIEMRFAHLKRILRLGRLRLRGPRGVQDEFVLAAIAQNLRRLAKLITHPPPFPAAHAPPS